MPIQQPPTSHASGHKSSAPRKLVAISHLSELWGIPKTTLHNWVNRRRFPTSSWEVAFGFVLPTKFLDFLDVLRRRGARNNKWPLICFMLQCQ
jgi:hypothetical protein